MTCPICGAPIPEEGKFCTVCGAPLAAAPAEETALSAEETVALAEETAVPAEGAVIPTEEGAAPAAPQPDINGQASFYGEQPYAQPYGQPYAPNVPPVKKKINPLAIILPIVAVVAVAALAVCLFLFVFKSSPLKALADAFENTKKETSYQADMEIGVNAGGIKVSIEMNGTVAVDPGTGDVTADFVMDIPQTGKMRLALYNKYLLLDMNGMSQMQDVSEYYEMLDFFAKQSDGEMSGDDYEKMFREFFELMNSEADFDELSKEIDFDKIPACEQKWKKCFSDQKWLEENLGFSVSSEDGETLYRFEPDFEKLAGEMREIFGEMFRNLDADEEMFDLDALDGELGGLTFSLLVRVKDNRIVGTEISFASDELEVSLSGKYYDYGNAEIDTKDLEKLLASAADAEDSYNYDDPDDYGYGDYFDDYDYSGYLDDYDYGDYLDDYGYGDDLDDYPSYINGYQSGYAA